VARRRVPALLVLSLTLALIAPLVGVRTAVAQPPSQPELLARIGRYVGEFQREFAVVVSDEDYQQRHVVRLDGGRREARQTRRLESEMVFLWVPERESWLTARNTRRVDGDAVPDSDDRLAAILEDTDGRQARLRQLRDEGARFNIGNVYRNFNDPTLVLQFLDPTLQRRFVFTLEGAVNVGGVEAWGLAFDEITRPSLIQSPTGDLLSTGSIRVRADGTVVQTRLVLDDPEVNTQATISVRYQPNDRLDVWAPSAMEETYVRTGFESLSPPGAPERRVPMAERIEGTATYSNFRRFETSVRLVIPE